MAFQEVTHVIFDMDGLLIDTESVDCKILTSIAAAFGKSYDLAIKKKTLGRTLQDVARIVIKELDLHLTENEFIEDYTARLSVELAETQLMPGASRLVKHLHKHNIPIAVATSSSENVMNLKTQRHSDIFSLFRHIVCGGSDADVKHGKPAPDIFLVCASRFSEKPNPANCLVFEDAPNGVIGAKSAGMQTVFVPSEYSEMELTVQNASLVIQSLLEFKPELFGLPPFDE